MYQLLLTTNDGIDDLAEEEFLEVAEANELRFESVELEPYGTGGHLLVTTDESLERILPAVETMRSIHHIIRYVDEFELPGDNPIEQIYQIEQRLHQIDLPEVEAADTFRITTNRYGDHDFTSIDVQRAAGAGVDRHYATSVDLTDYDVEVRVDIRHQRCLIGIQETQDPLTNRHPRDYNQKASLKTNVAWAMLKLAHIEEHQPRTLLDPFCGAGTILIEAAECYPQLEIIGSDISKKAADGARRNAKLAGVEQHITTRELDARKLSDTYAKGIADLIVTNPPFGLRLKAGMNFNDFYRDILEQFSYMLRPGGRLVILIFKRPVFRGELGNAPDFQTRHVRIVETGGLYPGIYVLQKRK